MIVESLPCCLQSRKNIQLTCWSHHAVLHGGQLLSFVNKLPSPPPVTLTRNTFLKSKHTNIAIKWNLLQQYFIQFRALWSFAIDLNWVNEITQRSHASKPHDKRLMTLKEVYTNTVTDWPASHCSPAATVWKWCNRGRSEGCHAVDLRLPNTI